MPKFSDFIKQDAKDKTLSGKKYSTVSSGDLIINKSPFISYGTNWAFINDNMENLLRLSSFIKVIVLFGYLKSSVANCINV